MVQQILSKPIVIYLKIYLSIVLFLFTVFTPFFISNIYAETVTASVTFNSNPLNIAVNPITNKVYVTHNSNNYVTVIDGSNNSTSTVTVGSHPWGIAVNPVTNKIYVANYSEDTATVIDGITNATTKISIDSNGIGVTSLAVNPVTNKIYVIKQSSTNVTVIDGNTNATTLVAVGVGPQAIAVNQVTNKIYVVNRSVNTVTVIDGATNLTETVSVGNDPFAIAVNPVTNKIYIANRMGDSITVIDGPTNSTTNVFVGSGSYPEGITVNPVTNKIYVANSNINNIVVIDGETLSKTTISAGSGPESIAVNPVTNRIYVVNGDNTVSVIDGDTESFTIINVGTDPWAIAVNPITNKIYTANITSNDVTVIDGATNSTTTVTVGANPTGVAVNPITNKIYVPNSNSNTVTVIDGATNSTSDVPTGTDPYDVAVNPITNKIYVPNYWSNTVTVIDGATNSTTTVNVGTNPVAVKVNPVTNKIYVSNSNSDTVTVIDGATNSTTDVPTGRDPGFLAVNPVTNKIYVRNFWSNDVTVITDHQKQSIPFYVNITPIAENIAYVANPTFNYSTINIFSPIAPPVNQVFYQVDTYNGMWHNATPVAGSGIFIIPSQTDGIHILYIFPGNGQEASSTANTGRGSLGNPITGAITSYIFLIASSSDNTPPSTIASPSGGTYTSAQSVPLTCNDGSGSGCQATYYCLGSVCNPTTVYTEAINISSSTDLRFYSIDNANNIETVKTETYTIIIDSDGDGYANDSDCNDNDNTVYPGAPEICDDKDNDCDAGTSDGSGETWYQQPTTCGLGVCGSTGQFICSGGVQTDTCTAGTPAGDDSDCNGVDENCDGTADNNYVPQATNCGVGVCASTGQLLCSGGVTSDSCTPELPSETPEASCSDGLDNDCDGVADMLDIDCSWSGFVDVAPQAGVSISVYGEWVTAWGDIDNDGDLDLAWTRKDGQDQLWRNNGNGIFTDISSNLGTSNGRGLVLGDYDNDGDLDLIITRDSGIALMQNNGSGQFTDVAGSAFPNIGGAGPYTSASFGDYDRDGYLDIFLAAQEAQGSQILYRNNGNGTFSDTTTAAGINSFKTWGGIFGDLDGDGWLDIVVFRAANDLMVFKNNGNGSFSDLTSASGLLTLRPSDFDIGDVDNDGDLDIVFVTDARAQLFINNGKGVFNDISSSAGMPSFSPADTAIAFSDFNNDGLQDIYISIGHVADRLLSNNGNNTFTDISSAAGLGITTGTYPGWPAFGDYDNDGDIDLYWLQHTGTNRLLNNQADNADYLEIGLEGTSSNRFGIGSAIRVWRNGDVHTPANLRGYREVTASATRSHTKSYIAHFGLDAAYTYDIEVTWPSGIVQNLTNVSTGQLLTISEIYNFEDGTFQGWTVFHGTWGLTQPGASGSNYKLSPSTTFETVVFAPVDFDYGTIEFDFVVDAGCCGDVHFNMNGEDQGGEPGLDTGDLVCALSPAGTDTPVITCEIGNTLSLGIQNSTFLAGTWNHVKIERPNKDTLRLYLNDMVNPVIESTAVALPLPGQLSMGFNSGTGSLDNIMIIRTGHASATDPDPPVTTASPSGGTYTSAQSITLTCDDGAGSGCADTFYCIGSGCTPTTPYSGAIDISSSATLRFYSTDNEGNSESVQEESYTLNIDSTPPTGSITINSGAAYTNNPVVTLSLSCTDASGCNQMCISNTASCSSWENYSPTKTWTLSSGDGTKTVYAWFSDTLENQSQTPFSGTIEFDTVAPTDGTVAATASNQENYLVWSGFSDATSGVSDYVLCYRTDDYPSSCSDGTPLYTGPNTHYTHSNLTNGTPYYYRLCAVDNATNRSSGTTISAMLSTSLTLTSPNGSETWIMDGGTKLITWQYAGYPGGNVRIELLKGGGVVSIIAENAPVGYQGSGSYSWLMPTNLNPGNDYQVRITSTTDSSYIDVSDNFFTIDARPSITIISPNGDPGELGIPWYKSQIIKKYIKWSFTGNPGQNVKIEVLKNGIPVLTKTWPTASSPSYFKREDILPLTPGCFYRVRITSTTNASYSDTSDRNFCIW